MMRKWILTIAIIILPTPILAQVYSGVQTGGVGSAYPYSGYNYPYARYDYPYARYDYPYANSYKSQNNYSNCWRSTAVRGTRTIWNCQPYPPP